MGRLHDVQDDLPQIRVLEGQLDVGGKPALLGSSVEPAALIDDPPDRLRRVGGPIRSSDEALVMGVERRGKIRFL